MSRGAFDLRLKAPVLILVLLHSAVVAAHHAPAHTASEGLLTATSLAAESAQASQRLLLHGEVARETEGPHRVASTRYTSSLSGSFMPYPWLSLGARFPWVVVREAGTQRQASGYGDTVVETQLTPPGEQPQHWSSSFGLRLSFPTRTYELSADPGRSYRGALLATLTRKYTYVYWQTMVLTTLESRPAGRAWEGSGGLFIGARSELGITGSLGFWWDTRLLAFCAAVDGSYDYCKQGRATELDRPTGATRGYVVLSASYQPNDFGIVAGLQVPVTERRDFLVVGFAGVQWNY